MRKLSSIAAISAATFVFSGLASAQTNETDYDFQWAPLANYVQVGLSGPFLFSFGGAAPVHFPGPGDAIRRCYSVDVTQGGKNQSSGQYETSWFTFSQGYAATNPIAGIDIGLLSMQSASDSDLGGDACLSPFFSSAGNTGGHGVGGATILGLQAGTAGAPFPSVWQSVWQWAGTASGLGGQNTIGTDPTNPFGAPLLANFIYEIQGPLNAGAGNNQYYLGTTDENVGSGASSATAGRGTGGVTNGNSAWGSSLFGVTADLSGAISHTRIFGFDPLTGGLTAGTAFWGLGAGTAEVNQFVAFSTPFLWAENDGSIGAGGPDWNIASGTPSMVNVWLKDIQSGANGNADTLWKGGGGGGPSAIYDPNMLFNYGYFLWSATPAIAMQQLPMSWDDLFGGAPPQAGSYFLATNTTREGNQSLPVNLDPLTNAMLGLPGLSAGTEFTSAESIWYDAGTGGLEAIWEGMFDLVESGLSKLSIAGGLAFPISSAPDPTLGGLNVGIAAIGIQVVLGGPAGVTVNLTEVANGLTVTLQ
jgi:hypothetical protein